MTKPNDCNNQIMIRLMWNSVTSTDKLTGGRLSLAHVTTELKYREKTCHNKCTMRWNRGQWTGWGWQNHGE